jgi:hypothetical protein
VRSVVGSSGGDSEEGSDGGVMGMGETDGSFVLRWRILEWTRGSPIHAA